MIWICPKNKWVVLSCVSCTTLFTSPPLLGLNIFPFQLLTIFLLHKYHLWNIESFTFYNQILNCQKKNLYGAIFNIHCINIKFYFYFFIWYLYCIYKNNFSNLNLKKKNFEVFSLNLMYLLKIYFTLNNLCKIIVNIPFARCTKKF